MEETGLPGQGDKEHKHHIIIIMSSHHISISGGLTVGTFRQEASLVCIIRLVLLLLWMLRTLAYEPRSQALLREPGSKAISPAVYMVVSVFWSMKAKSKSSQLE